VPIYEYTCKACNAKFEKLVKSAKAGAHVACPECGSKKTERAMSVFAVSAEGGRQQQSPPPRCCGCENAGMCSMGEE